MSDLPVWRVIDTGVRRAAENFALNRALLDARRDGASRSTLRFVQFRPSALLGYHQSAEQSLDLDYCRAHGIDVQRRLTGGGAIYMDECQFGWELYLDRAEIGSADMALIARRICQAAAAGLATMGVAARFRPRNDIEVDGRKISGTGGAFDGSALLYQGTVLVDMDAERMVRCLRIPAEKLADKAVGEARARVTTLRELLGSTPPLARVKAVIETAFAGEFGVRFASGRLSEGEERAYGAALAQIDTAEWIDLVQRPRAELPIVEATRRAAGGTLHAAVAYDRAARRAKQVWFTGDFFVQPRRLVADLEAALKDIDADMIDAAVGAFFAGREAGLLGLAATDFSAVVHEAIGSAADFMGKDEHAA